MAPGLRRSTTAKNAPKSVTQRQTRQIKREESVEISAQSDMDLLAESDKEKTIQKAKKRVVSDSESEKREQEQASKIIFRHTKALQAVKHQSSDDVEDVFVAQPRVKSTKRHVVTVIDPIAYHITRVSHQLPSVYIDVEASESEGVEEPDNTQTEDISEDDMMLARKQTMKSKSVTQAHRKIVSKEESDIEIIESPVGKGKQARFQEKSKHVAVAGHHGNSPGSEDLNDEDVIHPPKNTKATAKSKFKPALMTAQANIDARIINETDLESSSPSKGKKKVVYMEDIPEADAFIIHNTNAEKLPRNCEVTDQDLFDPMLEDTYNSLPPLRAYSLVTTNNGSEPPGPFALSNIPDAMPDAKMDIIVEAITFTRAGMFVNPSRASPACVKMQSLSDTQRSTIYALQANANNNFQYAVFTSVLAVTSSNLLDPDPQGAFRDISGTLCTQEWERFCAFFCMVFKEQELHAQIYNDAISISTRARPKDGTGAARHGFSHLLARGSPSKSPTKSSKPSSPVKVAGSSGSGAVKGALNFDEHDVDTVPVYDGREGKFNMRQLHILNRSLNAWNNDLSDSICLVGYTANTWMKDGVKQLSLNVQWVVVLASNVG